MDKIPEEEQNKVAQPVSAEGAAVGAEPADGMAAPAAVGAEPAEITADDLRYKSKGEVAKGGLLGFFIGLAVIVPGISGSTVAIIFKLYRKLLFALGNLVRKFRKCARFLVPIVLGIVVGFVVGFFAIQQVIDVSLFAVVALFAGLMFGAVPAVTDEIKGEKKTAPRILLLVFGFCVPVALSLVSSLVLSSVRSLEGLNAWQYILFLVLGYIVAITQIVPGLSATAILMMAGYFTPLMDSVHLSYWSANPMVFLVYACLAVGFVAGLLTVSKGLDRLLAKYRAPSFFCIVGLSLGSVVTMFFNPEVYAEYQSWAAGASYAVDLGVGLALFVVGVAAAYFFVRYERKKKA